MKVDRLLANTSVSCSLLLWLPRSNNKQNCIASHRFVSCNPSFFHQPRKSQQWRRIPGTCSIWWPGLRSIILPHQVRKIQRISQQHQLDVGAVNKAKFKSALLRVDFWSSDCRRKALRTFIY